MKIHELFPLDGNEPPEVAAMTIASIHVRRLENAKWNYATTSYAPDALESVGQLHRIYGGGDYTLEARDAEHRFLRVRRLTLPGSSKSLTGEELAPTPAATAAAVAPQMDSTTMFMAMMQTMMQQQSQSQQQMMQVVLAAMGRGDAGNADLNARRAELERQARTEYNDFVKMMVENARSAAPAAGGNQESFMQGVEFAQGLIGELVTKNADSDNPVDMLSTLKDLVAGLSQLRTPGNGATPPPS